MTFYRFQNIGMDTTIPHKARSAITGSWRQTSIFHIHKCLRRV